MLLLYRRVLVNLCFLATKATTKARIIAHLSCIVKFQTSFQQIFSHAPKRPDLSIILCVTYRTHMSELNSEMRACVNAAADIA